MNQAASELNQVTYILKPKLVFIPIEKNPKKPYNNPKPRSTGFIAHVNEYHEQEFQCSDGSIPRFLGGGFDKVVAVLAAQSSSVTLQVSIKHTSQKYVGEYFSVDGSKATGPSTRKLFLLGEFHSGFPSRQPHRCNLIKGLCIYRAPGLSDVGWWNKHNRQLVNSRQLAE